MRLGTLLPFVVMPLICGTTWANPIIVNIVNPNFDAPAISCALGYAYQKGVVDSSANCLSKNGGGYAFPQQDFNATIPGWTFSGGSGLTGPNTNFNPPTFDTESFTRAAFLQGISSVSQSLTGPAGMWTVSFSLGSRQQGGDNNGSQTVAVTVDNLTVAEYVLSNSTPFFQLQTVSFEAANGSHKLEFQGTVSSDSTAFISGVSASSVPEPASFVLMGAGLVGLGLLRRNQRRA